MNYCADRDLQGTLRPSSEWHCCKKGEWWNPLGGLSGEGGCEQAVECGIAGTLSEEGFGYCSADFSTNFAGWLNDKDCHKYTDNIYDPNLACCSGLTWFGESGYQVAPITKVWGRN